MRQALATPNGFIIDLEDHHQVQSILCELDLRQTSVEDVVEVELNDKEHRVCELDLAGKVFATLPTSIGLLQNLQHLDLSDIKALSQLPDEVGNMSSLKALDLSYSGIKMLPPSIGCLQNLQHLDLYWTKELSQLPDEVGNMTSLKILKLHGSNIKLLPPSIGCLQNLQRLDLGYTHKLETIPNDIGNLKSLKVLRVANSGIKILPRSIGGLRNLEVLWLHDNKNLSQFPKEIGNLTKLKVLAIGEKTQKAIEFLSNSAGNLKGLVALYLGDSWSETEKGEMTEQFPVLGKIRCDENSEKGMLAHALARNRARFRMGCRTAEEGCVPTTPQLWSLVLHGATIPFSLYRSDVWYDPSWAIEIGDAYGITKPDAIYQLLLDNRESFLLLLMNPTGTAMMELC